ncbi:MAG: GTPase HflX [Candidatus Omnitrophica bacterium]|nr:GTPase HflX [Candidatus Omnitrophota bacterium]
MQNPNVLTGANITGKKALVIDLKETSEKIAQENIKELESLAKTLGLTVIKSLLIRHPEHIYPATYIGKGKIQEIKKFFQDLGCDLVIFGKELTPVQQRNLEDSIGASVIDRTVLILLIFGKHAHTLEGKLQVELAQMTYLLPRLAGSYGRLSRLGGTIGTRGPGEQKLEVYRRRIRKRIQILNKKIEEIEKHRAVIRASKRRQSFPLVALIGYTNVGKSTLLNALTHRQDAVVDNALFSTLDPLTRLVHLGDSYCLVSDTVGLLSSLPHHLIAAFRATLEELKFSNLLVCLIDATSFNIEKQIKTIEDVLELLKISEKAKIMVFNKIDCIDEGELNFLKSQYPEAIFLSAKTGEGFDVLKDRIKHMVGEYVSFRF